MTNYIPFYRFKIITEKKKNHLCNGPMRGKKIITFLLEFLSISAIIQSLNIWTHFYDSTSINFTRKISIDIICPRWKKIFEYDLKLLLFSLENIQQYFQYNMIF